MSDWSLRLARCEDADAMPAIEAGAAALFATDPELAKLDIFDDGWKPDELRKLIARGHCLVSHIGEEMAGLGFAEVDPKAHPRLAGYLAQEAKDGLPAQRRYAMILSLDQG